MQADAVLGLRPLRQFILKVHGRCNLACDYCYVYQMADQRWRTRPVAMSRDTMDQVALRIAEHATTHALPSVDVVIHGGEPLLAGEESIAYCVSAIRAAAGDQVDVRFALQTNGTLLETHMLRALCALRIRISVSVDGAAEAHDRHRRTARGTGSHREVGRALRLLNRAEFRPAFAGLLCTVDMANDPIETYEALAAFDPPAVDFLLPHGTWLTPPPGRDPGGTETPYADWLIRVFDHWYGAPRRRTGIRLFEEIINVLLGGSSHVEGIGLTPALLVVVETDGSIEQADVLAATFEGAAATGLHVAHHSFDTALRLPAIAARQAGIAGLPVACRDCAVHRICGGGLPAHRYRGVDGFDHPSVYCPDLYRLIGHIRGRLSADLLASRRRR